MTNPPPDPAHLRISDADRERAVQQLNDAVAEGRLTIGEFDERVAAVLSARTAGEIAPHLADLPGGANVAAPSGGGAVAGLEYGELKTTMSTLARTGRWTVPRRVQSKAGTVTLDFTAAVIPHPVVEVSLDVYLGTTHLILPPDASVNVEQVENGMVASNIKVRGVPPLGQPVRQAPCGGHRQAAGGHPGGPLPATLPLVALVD